MQLGKPKLVPQINNDLHWACRSGAFPFRSGYPLYLFKRCLRVAQSPFKKDAATIPNAGSISITISNFTKPYISLHSLNMVKCNFNIQYSLFFMFLNFLMVLKPYISLYSLYGSITISKFKNQFQISQNLTFPYIPYMVECNFNIQNS